MGCIVLSNLSTLSDGSYLIGWILSLDRIVSAVLDRIVLYCIGWIRKHRIFCTGWLLPGWDGWTGWGVGGTGVERMDVSIRRNGSAAMGVRTGAPPLALEGRQSMKSGICHQLCRCCKDAEYLYRRRKIMQIECTQI